MTDRQLPLTEDQIRELLESRWDELSSNVAARVAREVVWMHRMDWARNCVLAASVLLMVQIGLDSLFLAKLQALRGQAAASLRAVS